MITMPTWAAILYLTIHFALLGVIASRLADIVYELRKQGKK